MADTVINLTSQPTMPNGAVLNQGNWAFKNNRLQSNSIGNSQNTRGYIKFDAVVGTISATIGVSSEKNYDTMCLHVSTTEGTASGNANMADISGEVKSATYTYNITAAGTYYLNFYYFRDSSGYSGEDCGWITSVTLPLKEGGIVYTNVNGVWKKGIQYANVSGVWKQGETYTNVNGVWKQGQ